jgi:dsDNA-binding SOS-regulon protein
VFFILQKYFGEDFYQGEETEKPTFEDDDEDDDYDDGMLDVAEAIFTNVVAVVNMSCNLAVHQNDPSEMRQVLPESA